MRHQVDIKSWESGDRFVYYKGFLNPFVSVTSEVVCDKARAEAKTKNESFFLYYLYAVLRAANEIENFKYRIEDNEVVYYDTLRMLTPIRVNQAGQFVTVLLDHKDNFENFYKSAQAKIERAKTNADPYGIENTLTSFDVILLSALPDVYLSGSATAQKHADGSDYPLLSAGKCVFKDNHEKLPVSLSVHHGFVDFKDIGVFYKKTETLLENIRS